MGTEDFEKAATEEISFIKRLKNDESLAESAEDRKIKFIKHYEEDRLSYNKRRVLDLIIHAKANGKEVTIDKHSKSVYIDGKLVASEDASLDGFYLILPKGSVYKEK